jgi:hypothetical protein
MDSPIIGSLAPSYRRRNQPPLMDPQAIRARNVPSVNVPVDGIRAGLYGPRGIVPEFYANHTPQPPPPGYGLHHRSMTSFHRNPLLFRLLIDTLSVFKYMMF